MFNYLVQLMTALDKKAAVAGTKTKDFIDDKIGNKVVCFVCMCFFPVRHGEKTQCGIWHFLRAGLSLCLVTKYP